MSNDPEFDYVLARSRTRESSILTVGTVAASASLLLLGLFFQVDGTSKANMGDIVKILGISFGLLGIFYREVTAKTIHAHDERWLKAYLKNCGNKELKKVHDDNNQEIQHPLNYRKKTGREPAIVFLLATPLVGWGCVFFDFFGLLFILAPVIYLSVLSCSTNKE